MLFCTPTHTHMHTDTCKHTPGCTRMHTHMQACCAHLDASVDEDQPKQKALHGLGFRPVHRRRGRRVSIGCTPSGVTATLGPSTGSLQTRARARVHCCPHLRKHGCVRLPYPPCTPCSLLQHLTLPEPAAGVPVVHGLWVCCASPHQSGGVAPLDAQLNRPSRPKRTRNLAQCAHGRQLQRRAPLSIGYPPPHCACARLAALADALQRAKRTHLLVARARGWRLWRLLRSGLLPKRGVVERLKCQAPPHVVLQASGRLVRHLHAILRGRGHSAHTHARARAALVVSGWGGLTCKNVGFSLLLAGYQPQALVNHMLACAPRHFMDWEGQKSVKWRSGVWDRSHSVAHKSTAKRACSHTCINT